MICTKMPISLPQHISLPQYLQQQPRQAMLRSLSLLSHALSTLSQPLFLSLAQKKLTSLTALAEQSLDHLPQVDISSTDKILRVNASAVSIVVNTQTPNRQLWYSSTVSGPKRFDYDAGGDRWVGVGGIVLDEVFEKDIGNIK